MRRVLEVERHKASKMAREISGTDGAKWGKGE